MAIRYVCQAAGSCEEKGLDNLQDWKVSAQISAAKNFRSSCYILSTKMESFEDAQETCLKNGAALVVIHDAEENKFVQELCGREACWIGLSEPPNSENYFWSDGSAAGSKEYGWKGYTNWNPGEPNNWDGKDEDAVFMNYWDNLGMPRPWEGEGALGKWYDAPRDMEIKYVCQKRGLCDQSAQVQLGRSFRESCYTIASERKAFDAAASACQESGGLCFV